MDDVSPEKILKIATGYWASNILSTAAQYKLFDFLDDEALSTTAFAEKAGVSPRGAQALLDGLLGLELVELTANGYKNSADASAFLVSGKREYLGGFAQLGALERDGWAEFATSVKTGKPGGQSYYEIEKFEFWERLVTSIAPLAFPPAQAAARKLELAAKPAFEMLDVGGGAGVYSCVWLNENKKARSTQLDWDNVNTVARQFVKNFGIADRFQTRDGNLLDEDFGEKCFDYAVYSHMAHGLGAAQNLEVFKKFRKALKPGGTLVVADFILDERRKGHPMALMFFANMLHATEAGQTYRDTDYRSWLTDAGFETVELQRLEPMPVSLIYAR